MEPEQTTKEYLSAVGRWARDHPGLVISTITLLFAGFNILAFSNFNPEVAQTVIQEQGLAAVATGQLLEIASTVLPLVLCVAIALPALRRLDGFTFITPATTWTIWPVAVLVLLFLPRFMSAYIVALPLLLGLSAWLGTRLSKKHPPRADLGGDGADPEAGPSDEADRNDDADERLAGPGYSAQAAGVMFALLSVLLVLDQDPWLPRERIDRTGGASVTGYVLNRSGLELVVVRAESKEVLRLDASTVTRRSLCDWSGARDTWDRPLVQIGPRATYPTCARE